MTSSRVALVTGGASGIGYGISRALALEGVSLALCGRRDESRVQDALEALRALEVEVLYVSADVADAADRAAVLEAVRRRFGRLDVLVNNAGVGPRERNDILDATEESYDWVMGINLKGPYFLTQAVARWMIEQRQDAPDRSQAVVNVGSISATVASTNRGEYCLSKAGMGMATQLWAARLGEVGIPVYEVRPGVTRSDMTSGVTDKYDRLIEDGLLVQSRWGEPEDVGKAVAMLARGDLPYSTGQVVMVDGGLTLARL
ncbi:3-ketoacyl-ACP reductase [Rubrivirga sp.]|uniref:3-ketoacyl-ACP reductase n=1 Tax=Rubrivirga sp. TaxID=1885344 RepID=UPI003B52A5F7